MRLLIIICLLALELFGNPYTVIIDAGSTGTRANIFSSTKKVKLKAYCKDTGVGGIQKLADDYRSDYYLKPTLDCMKAKLFELGAKNPEQVPVGLMATGGLRLLSQENQDHVLALVVSYFQIMGFPKIKFEVLSGEKEGLFAWITVNYLAKTLGKPLGKTIGVLDMGGATTQIAFAPYEKPKEHGMEFEFAGIKYDLYVHSYKGLGQREVSKRVATPACFQRGLEHDLTVLRQVELGDKFHNDEPAAGNYHVCRRELAEHLFETCPTGQDCGLKDTYQPPLRGRFVAISAFAQLASHKVLNLKEFSPAALDEAGEVVCAYTWEEYQKIGNDKPRFLSTACYEAAYYSALLSGRPEVDSRHDGLGFAKDSNDLKALFQINDIEVSWALGAAVYWQTMNQ